MPILLKLNHTYSVRDPDFCIFMGWPVQDTIIKEDRSGDRDFVGVSGNAYYRDGTVYGYLQKWGDDLVREV
jgi:hypothetical protein